ncbi:MAG: cohesin domain-containing protein [Acidobacteriota bacterium]
MQRLGALTISLLFAATGALAGCDSGGGSGGSTPPTAPSPAIIVTPDGGGSPPRFGIRSGSGSTSDLLQLEIFAAEIVQVQAIDFNLTVPNTLLRLDNFERGELIGAGAQVILQNGGSSAPSFEILRTAPSGATGSGIVLTLTFAAIGAGNGRFDFIDPVAEDPLGLEIPNVDWIGAAVQVIR